MSGGKRARREPGSRTRKGLLLFVGGLVVVALGLGWSVNQVLSDTSDPSDTSDTAAPTGDASRAATGAGGAVEECAADVTALEEAVEAARPGIDHWRTHVKARTDMIEGRISEKKMDAIYESTKQHGHADHERFAAAVAAIERQVPCEEMQARPTDSMSPEGRDCLARSESAKAALTVATSTMDEWQSHLKHMEQYADGGMRQGKALRLWIQAWRQAPPGITAFDERVADLAEAPSCSAA